MKILVVEDNVKLVRSISDGLSEGRGVGLLVVLDEPT